MLVVRVLYYYYSMKATFLTEYLPIENDSSRGSLSLGMFTYRSAPSP